MSVFREQEPIVQIFAHALIEADIKPPNFLDDRLDLDIIQQHLQPLDCLSLKGTFKILFTCYFRRLPGYVHLLTEKEVVVSKNFH